MLTATHRRPGLYAYVVHGLRWLACVLLAWAALAALASPVAHAGGLSVLPTRIDFSAARPVESLLLTNTSTQAMTVETDVKVWPEGAADQRPGDIVVNPPVVTLAPGERVRIRVGRVRMAGSPVERAYRLYLTELPPPGGQAGVDIGVRLRIGVPLFIAPTTTDSRALQWSLQPGETGWTLVARNPGNLHTRIGSVRLNDDPEPLALTSPYVLAGQPLVIALPRPLASAPAVRVRWQEAGHERQADVARMP